jgi:hypothetical protein
MSKRKRASLGKNTGSEPLPAGSAGEGSSDEASKDDAAKEDMVHVTPDLLSSSPDIFSSKRKYPGDVSRSEPETVAEPIEPEPVQPEPIEPELPEHEASTEMEKVFPTEVEPIAEPASAEPMPAPEAPMTPPPPPPTPRRPVRRNTAGSSAALGIVLVVVGLFALLVAFAGVDLTTYGWPLFVIVPGLTLLVVGFVGVGQGASIPGGVVTMLGLLLAYQSSTGDWATWTFAWALVAPFGVGLGMYLQALRERDAGSLRTGRTLMFIGLVIFMIGFVLFESILGLSGKDYGLFGKAALPLLLIVIGFILLWRSIQRARRA